jgi:hypothetical protein
MNTSHDDLRRLVDWHFGKGLSLTNEARLRNHLPACADCREAYEVYQAAERLDAKALGPCKRLATALGLPADVRWPRRRVLRWGIGTLSGVGAMTLLLIATSSTPSTELGRENAPRGNPIENAEPLEVTVFRVKGEWESIRVKDVVSPRDELAFAYRNEVGKSFLMIFAIDGAGHLVWYHPAWTDPADNPTAVPITKQVGFKELPEAVRQSLQGPSLTVHALFMEKALDVREVEARAARGEFTANADAGEILRTMVFEVRP